MQHSYQNKQETQSSIRNNNECHILLPLNFVPVIKPKKSCKAIINLNLHNFWEEIESKCYFSEGEIYHIDMHKRKVHTKRKEHSVINDSFTNKAYEMFYNDDNGIPCSKKKNQSSSLLGSHLLKEKPTIYLSLQKRKEMKHK